MHPRSLPFRVFRILLLTGLVSWLVLGVGIDLVASPASLLGGLFDGMLVSERPGGRVDTFSFFFSPCN